MKKLLTLLLTLLLGILSLFGCSQSTDQAEFPEVEEIVSTFSKETIIDEQAGTMAKRVNISVYPEDAINTALDYSVFFEGESPALTKTENGEQITYYPTEFISIVPDYDGALSATIICKKSFPRGMNLELHVKSRFNSNVKICIPIIYKGFASSLIVKTDLSKFYVDENRNNAYVFPSGTTISFSYEYDNLFHDVRQPSHMALGGNYYLEQSFEDINDGTPTIYYSGHEERNFDYFKFGDTYSSVAEKGFPPKDINTLWGDISNANYICQQMKEYWVDFSNIAFNNTLSSFDITFINPFDSSFKTVVPGYPLDFETTVHNKWSMDSYFSLCFYNIGNNSFTGDESDFFHILNFWIEDGVSSIEADQSEISF